MKKFYTFVLLFILSTTLFAADEEESEIAAIDNLGPSASGFLSEGDFGPDDDEYVDPHVLRDFIESKGLIECRKKNGLLTIAGDARARWIAVGERAPFDEETRLSKRRGAGTNTAINTFKSEFNLFMDYVAPRSWVSTKMRWVNFDGKDGGSATRVEMERAFIGYDIRKQQNEDFYIELGRSKLDFIFDSRVMYTSTFDGIHLYYTRTFPSRVNFVIHGGPFLVDTFTNHYAWIMETSLLELCNTGFGVKFSIVDWGKTAPTLDYGNRKDKSGKPISGKTLVRDNPRYKFLVSQWLLGHQSKIDFLGCKTLYLYGAFLHNHDAKRIPQTDFRKLNNAWYAGFTLGKLCKACDWSLDVIYESVQVQAVPEFDLSGIGHGNEENVLFSDAILQGFDFWRARGFTNFKGASVSLLYAMTDNISIRAIGQYATPRNSEIGGDFRYKGFEMSIIYAF